MCTNVHPESGAGIRTHNLLKMRYKCIWEGSDHALCLNRSFSISVSLSHSLTSSFPYLESLNISSLSTEINLWHRVVA